MRQDYDAWTRDPNTWAPRFLEIGLRPPQGQARVPSSPARLARLPHSITLSRLGFSMSGTRLEFPAPAQTWTFQGQARVPDNP
ncbi:hypothetical protein NL676_030839 [Syzygium grande]|nr:hypothetical protein NL676_030839 [Syzygium grande]